MSYRVPVDRILTDAVQRQVSAPCSAVSPSSSPGRQIAAVATSRSRSLPIGRQLRQPPNNPVSQLQCPSGIQCRTSPRSTSASAHETVRSHLVQSHLSATLSGENCPLPPMPPSPMRSPRRNASSVHYRTDPCPKNACLQPSVRKFCPSGNSSSGVRAKPAAQVAPYISGSVANRKPASGTQNMGSLLVRLSSQGGRNRELSSPEAMLGRPLIQTSECTPQNALLSVDSNASPAALPLVVASPTNARRSNAISPTSEKQTCASDVLENPDAILLREHVDAKGFAHDSECPEVPTLLQSVEKLSLQPDVHICDGTSESAKSFDTDTKMIQVGENETNGVQAKTSEDECNLPLDIDLSFDGAHIASALENTNESIEDLPTSVSCSTSHPRNLKLVVFDFDCTLTSFHVFASLSGAVGGLTLSPPYALTEKGQVERLIELDADLSWGPGVFALKAFGGPKRLEQLQYLLEVLRSSSVECIVLSKGMTQVIRKLLEQVKLLSFFARIIGNEGCVMGCTDYDHEVASRSGCSKEALSVKGEMQDVVKRKADKLQQLMEERRLHFYQTVFVDDDEKEIGGARCVCQTVHVSTSTGIKAKDVIAILSIAAARHSR